MPLPVERVQTGVRLEKHLLQVLKALGAYLDLSLGDLLEGIVLHAFEGQAPFSDPTLTRIATLRSVYDLKLTAADSHQLLEHPEARVGGRARRGRGTARTRSAALRSPTR